MAGPCGALSEGRATTAHAALGLRGPSLLSRALRIPACLCMPSPVHSPLHQLSDGLPTILPPCQSPRCPSPPPQRPLRSPGGGLWVGLARRPGHGAGQQPAARGAAGAVHRGGGGAGGAQGQGGGRRRAPLCSAGAWHAEGAVLAHGGKALVAVVAEAMRGSLWSFRCAAPGAAVQPACAEPGHQAWA